MCKFILNPRDPEVQIAMERLAGGPDAYCNTHTWRYIYTQRQAPDRSAHVFAHACHPDDLEPRIQAVTIPDEHECSRPSSLSIPA